VGWLVFYRDKVISKFDAHEAHVTHRTTDCVREKYKGVADKEVTDGIFGFDTTPNQG
jgi:hypothetical protein